MYQNNQLIAYIGNKRRLLPLIATALQGIGAGADLFVDLFAGSGAVARLAKSLGRRVVANDWETYAWVLNHAFVSINPARVAFESGRSGLFQDQGGLCSVLERLNALPADPERAYLSAHYAPAADDPEQADYRRERLFYTRANALKLDAVRNAVEDLYPGVRFPSPGGGSVAEGDALDEKALLTALLLYEAATHVNTSGVFKACHKGFGGHGRDALGRILAPVRLHAPQLFESPAACRATCRDAIALLESDAEIRRGGAVVYLDPPYNQHQYGSNYHLLNSLALWDRPPVSDERGPDGSLLHKAAIRRDWIRTRSDFCVRNRAPAALRAVLNAVDARAFVLSYSSDGIICFDELLDMCAERGRVELVSDEYTSFRGGRQTPGKQRRTIEFVLIVDTRQEPGQVDARVRRTLALRRLALFGGRRFHPARFAAERTGLSLSHDLRLMLPRGQAWDDLARGAQSALEDLTRRLERAVCTSAIEELEVLLEGFAAQGSPQCLRPAVKLLRRLAHRKYKADFLRLRAALHAVQPHGLQEVLADLDALAARRFSG